MKYFIGFFTWILIASAWPMAPQQLEAAQANKPQPADIRIDHDVFGENEPVRDIFLDLLHNTGVHGGFAQFVDCSELPKGRLNVKQGITTREAMDALVAVNPSYQWNLKDGVVNLLPRRGVPLLRTRIAKFRMEATDQEVAIFFKIC